MSKPAKSEPPKHEPKRFCGVAGRSGPPKGNRNNLRHGLRAGQLPADAKFIEIRLNSFRRQLEDAVIKVRGEISIPDAASIQTAMRWERHAALAQRWLTKSYNDLKPADRLTFSREIARASAERDKALAMLRLDVLPEPLDLKGYLAQESPTP
ncbi:MAG: hypothetical protein SH850_05440 [Planctomycetaceae bacterium]|nr:hypothetical protein [Planctomycetaceae bacterium]